ncbi:hypothetical protein [Methylobacterium oxalidis]|uniref:hypothetical protein n=1 Tax=Methylobacterium oxalidis TaxID=944322 RepID=UPI003315F418
MPKLANTPEALDALRRLGRIAATRREAALYFDIPEGELDAFLAGHPQARAAFDAERRDAQPSRRRQQLNSSAPADMVATARRLGLLPREVRP